MRLRWLRTIVLIASGCAGTEPQHAGESARDSIEAPIEVGVSPAPLPSTSATQRPGAPQQSVTRIPSDDEGIDLLIRCDLQIPTSGYAAETDSGVPLDSDYARARGLDKGLISIMRVGVLPSQPSVREDMARVPAPPAGERRHEFVLPKADIQAAIQARYDTPQPDKVDALITKTGELIVVETTTINAGIFTVSDVWRLPAVARVSELPPRAQRNVERALEICGIQR